MTTVFFGSDDDDGVFGTKLTTLNVIVLSTVRGTESSGCLTTDLTLSCRFVEVLIQMVVFTVFVSVVE